MSTEMKSNKNERSESPPSSSFSKTPRRRKLGRASRRRKNKIRAIRQSVQILLSGGEGDGEGLGIASAVPVSSVLVDNKVMEDENNCLPTDRSRSLPGVIARRRQFSNNRESHDHKEGQGFDEDGKQSHLQSNGLDKNDEAMLTSQLGFIPGNGISVVSKVKNIKGLYPQLFKLLCKPIAHSEQKNQQSDYPMVLQLYPLVTRDVYDGGKSDGRKFKSRKRCFSHTVASSEGHDESANNVKQKDTNNNEEAIFIEKTGNVGDKSELRTTIEPFPTMYWLTHPHLRTLISQLEIEPTHNVTTMEKKLSASPDHLKAMRNAHESYGKQRWDLLTDEDKKDTEVRRWVDALGMQRGVAGIRNFATVKCLHAHAAHYLATFGPNEKGQHDGVADNLVGRWVLEAVEELISNGGRISGHDPNDDDEIDD